MSFQDGRFYGLSVLVTGEFQRGGRNMSDGIEFWPKHVYDVAKERNDGEDPSKILLEYESELQRLRAENEILRAKNKGLEDSRTHRCATCFEVFDTSVLAMAHVEDNHR